MPSAAELQVVVNADVSPAESKLSGFGSGLGSALGLGVAAAGAAIAAGVAVGVKAAGDLEQSVANISTIKPEIDTSAVFASLSEMSTRIPQTASQLGESLYNVFSSVNVSAEQGLQLVETFAKGAVGAGTSAETFGTAAMGVMNAYGLSVSDASHISDVFFNTVNAGVVTGEELASSLGPVTQSAKAAGVSLDELGAMIVGVTKEGGPAAQNINNLNNLLQKVTTKEAQKGMNDLGVATKTATGDFRPTIEVMRDLKTHLAGMTESARAAALQTIFPDAQARIGALTIMSQIDAVDAALETNKTAVGSTASAYEKMSATFNSQSKLLMNGLTAILTTVGAMLLPLITPLVTAFSTALPGAFQSAMTALAPFGAMLMSLGPTIAAAVQIASDAWGTLQQVFAGEWAPDASIQPFVNALGMVAIVVRDQVLPAISALLAIDYSILSTVGAFIISQFQVVVDWFVANWPLILQTIQTVGDAITAFWGAWGGTILTVIQASWTMISTAISTALAVILGLVTAAMQAINGDWSGAWATLSTVAQTAMTGMQTILQAGWDAVVAVVTTALALLQPIVETTWTAITTAIQTAMTAVQETISTAMTAVQETISTAWTTITTAIQTALTTVGTVIQTAWGAITSQVSTAMLAIQTAIKAVWDLIPADIQADLILIANHLITQGAAWLATMTTTMTQILTIMQTGWTTIQTTTSTILEAISTVVTTVWAAIVSTVTTQTAAVLAAVTTAWNAVSAITTTIWNAVVEAVSGPLGQIVAAVQNMGAQVLGALRSLAGEAAAAGASIGSSIMEGISGGISARAGAIAASAAAAVRGALSAAKAAIGAESPSTAFRDEVGKMMADGTAEGVTAGAPGIMEATVSAIVTALDAARVAIEGLTAKIGQLLSAMAGQVGTVFTGMTTAVTAETATMAAAVTEQVVQLGTRLIEETTNAAGITVERYREMSGEIVTIVTGQNGAVLADFTTKAGEIGLVTDTLGTKLISSTTTALGQTTEVYREKSGEIVTLVIGAGGQIVAEYTATATAAVAKATEMKSGVVKQFAETAAGAVKATESFDTFKGSLASIKPPDLSSTVKQLDSVTKAAGKAADAIKDINQASKGGSSGGNSGLAKKAGGGWTQGLTLVGEEGPELMSFTRPAFITPNDKVNFGGGDGNSTTINVYGAGTEDVSSRVIAELRRQQILNEVRR